MLTLSKYSFGVGDRFAQEARAQLRAFLLAAERGLEIVPVWNKSNREHAIVGSEPGSALEAARDAVQALGWTRPFHLDAEAGRQRTADWVAARDAIPGVRPTELRR